VGLSVATRATVTRLTTKERVKLELTSISGSGSDSILDALIDAAGGAIHSFCNRRKAPFYRQVYSETLAGYGNTTLMLAATPVVSVASVLQDTDVITDYTIEDADAGLLNRRYGFMSSAQLYPGLSGRQTFPSFGAPIPNSEEPRLTVAYTAGYLLPSQDLSAKTTISASAVDNSFNDTAGAFPALLKAGDVIVVTGFATAANNGLFTVTGTPTSSKIVVTSTLATEAAPAASAIVFRTLPFDLEMACVQTVKAWYLELERNPSVMAEAVADVSMQYFAAQAQSAALPPLAAALARQFVRAA
jgi:hypothetical protein